jgi:two-component system sensor histidine kinase KdpD
MTGRGTLRVYLGAAPGVGKTFAMLSEAQRARERGADIVIGFVETHGRPKTAEQIAGLEVVPRRSIEYRATVFEEMDVDAVLARRPERALVDELAHTNVPGSRNPKRWQDVEELLDAGIDVITTVNIQHLESLNDVVTQITGVTQRETIPDAVVRAAEQVELVDQTPEALRRRMAHGNIYGPEKIDAALANYFRVGNLTALRELALLWLADRVDDELEDYRARHGISRPWETRERVVVALTGAPGREHLIRRASRIAQRAHGSCWACTCNATTACPGRPTSTSTATARCWPSSAAATAPSPGPTSPPRWWPSPAGRTPPRSCWAPPPAAAGRS